MKKWKSSQNGSKNQKYGLSAFQNRSQNIAATLRSIFMIWWMLVIFGKNRNFGLFWGNQQGTNWILKIDLEVAETFWDRFWKAQTPYFPSPNFNFEFGPFRNQNGKSQFQHQKPTFFAIYRFGSKKASKIRDFLLTGRRIPIWKYVALGCIFEKTLCTIFLWLSVWLHEKLFLSLFFRN